jgi:hypothetical protein
MPISRRHVTPFRRRRSLDGGPNVPPRLRRRALLTGRQAQEILHQWDRQITRLRRRVDELEEQNARLVVALGEAVEICDAAMAPGRAPIFAQVSSQIAHACRVLSSQSARLRSQLRLRWRPWLFSAALLSLTYRRKLKPMIGWPFEPVDDDSESPAGSTAAVPLVAPNTGSRFHNMGRQGAESPSQQSGSSNVAPVSQQPSSVGNSIGTESR